MKLALSFHFPEKNIFFFSIMTLQETLQGTLVGIPGPPKKNTAADPLRATSPRPLGVSWVQMKAGLGRSPFRGGNTMLIARI